MCLTQQNIKLTNYPYKTRQWRRIFDILTLSARVREIRQTISRLYLYISHFQDREQIIRLWYHECCRVYQDRLINDADRDWFNDVLNHKIRTEFGQNPETVLGSEIILFGDFLDPTSDLKLYTQITDMDKVRKSI